MAQIKISEIEDCLASMIQIELSALAASLREANLKKDESTIKTAASYVMGMERVKDMLNIILKDVKE